MGETRDLSPPAPASKMYGRRLITRLDWGIAAVLFVASLWILLATSTMGTTRDESFYFRYGSVYQEWFERVAGDPDATGPSVDPLGRRDVVSTWSQNFEHPPLMKTLFGLSWRWLGNKHRPLYVTASADGPTLQVRDLGPADGFQKGDTVALFAPKAVSNDNGAPQGASLGRAVVTRRDTRHAELSFEGDLTTLDATCSPPKAAPGPHPWIHGCRAASSGSLQWLDEQTAMRFPGQLFSAVLVAVLFLFGVELFGRWAGLFAALAFFWVPRHFFHAHLCCFDMPVTTLIVATVWAWWRSLVSRRWVAITAVLWGIGLLTKLNAFFIPIPLLAAWLLPSVWRGIMAAPARLRAMSSQERRALLGRLVRLEVRVTLPPLPSAFLWMPPVGLTMLFLLWPRLWYEPAKAFGDYVGFHLTHVHYLQQYFGHILSAPPFPVDYPWIMTALTVPLPLLALGAIGLWRLVGPERGATNGSLKVLLLANVLFPIVLISLPNTPIFGGIKHWMATLAFWALLGGLGFQWLLSAFASWSVAVRGPLAALSLAIIVSGGATASLRYVNHGTSYYNALAGGLRGAADLRMHRQFWGYGSRLALDWLNEHAPRGATIAFHNTTYDSFFWYQRDGLLREDLRWKRNPGSRCRGDRELYVFHHQESFAQDRIEAMKGLKTDVPRVVFTIDDVPIVSVFQCEHPGRPGAKP